MEPIAQGQTAVAEGAPAPKPVDFTNVPSLSDADVRNAIVAAEAKGIDPDRLTVTEMAELQNVTPAKAAESPRISPDQAVNPNAVKLDIPDQFRKSDGEPDVDKLKDETKRLNELTQAKEEKIEKSVEDYLREYKESQNKFRNTPNPEKFEERLRTQELAAPSHLTDQQLREMIMNDYRVDPISTTTQLIEAAVQRHLQPFSEEKRERSLRANVEALAKDDPRILNDKIFAEIKKELDANPHLWSNPNPHRSAWLEVKERLRLGEPPQRAAQAQPSRPPSPVLGAGAPPSAPSPSEYRTSSKTALDSLDVRDKKQEAIGDEMMRRALERKTY